MHAGSDLIREPGKRVLDVLFFVPALLSAAILRLSRTLGYPAAWPLTRRALDFVGLYPLVNHYYDPYLRPGATTSSSEISRVPGIDFAVQRQVELLRSLPDGPQLEGRRIEGRTFTFDNPTYGAGDAELLYAIICKFRPRKFIEVGAGMSSLIVRAAIDDAGLDCQHTIIEPYENAWLDSLGAHVLRTPVQNCPITLFLELDPGDVLFIDSSHVVAPGSDVNFEVLGILPQLTPGVLVHFHDIFTPRDYPAHWLLRFKRHWHEQYLVEALMSNSTRYEVLVSSNLLRHSHPEELQRICPSLMRDPEAQPGSFWIRVCQ